MISPQPAVDPKLASAIRTVIFRESGKAPLSVVISSLRNQGWTRLGSTDLFAQKCEQAGFKIEHQYKRNDPTTIARTFVVLAEEELV
jgi:hypothetical protein